MAKSVKELSRIDWHTEPSTINNPGGYPGDHNIKLGCLMRIADSLEKMEKPFMDLIEENKRLKERWAKNFVYTSKLEKRLAAYKGIINRMKKEKK